ncbi:hypothetical protein YTPLAS72_04690 [Nitrospira sp.]|nr:hypothetical protein YTPLAS72_04690 [Nitrospira sp.]
MLGRTVRGCSEPCEPPWEGRLDTGTFYTCLDNLTTPRECDLWEEAFGIGDVPIEISHGKEADHEAGGQSAY